MAFRIFSAPIPVTDEVTMELNGFLSQHRVVNVSQHLTQVREQPYCVFVVEYVGGASTGASSLRSPSAGGGSGKVSEPVDYRAKLGDVLFAVYNELRKCRNSLAHEAGVSNYTVMTNQQLCDIVLLKPTSAAELKKVNGVGDNRYAKYGERLYAAYLEGVAVSKEVEAAAAAAEAAAKAAEASSGDGSAASESEGSKSDASSGSGF
ncbi:MAG: HRDC domain-containing protein [Oligosphaeraceae bacterium]